jgi:hypothetical protein
VGAKFEVRRELLAAPGASPGRLGVKEIGLKAALFVEHPAAPVAFQKRLPAFDGNQGNEEKAEIVIQPFPPRRRQAAVRAGPGLVVDLDFLRLHSADEDEGAPLLKSPEFPMETFRQNR